jgi:hypothetical protein
MQRVIHVQLTRGRELVCSKAIIQNRVLTCSGIVNSIYPSREIISMEEKAMSAAKILKIMTSSIKRKYTKRATTKKKLGRPRKNK